MDVVEKMGKIQVAATHVVQVFQEFMKCSVSGDGRVGVFLSFCYTQSVPFFLIQKTNLVAKLGRNIFYKTALPYDISFHGSVCTNDGDAYPYLYKDNEIGVGEVTALSAISKCAAFCHPYVEHKGYVGFGYALDCPYKPNCNQCLCFFDAGFLPDTDFDNIDSFTAVGPVNGATGSDSAGFGTNDRCYPYKVSMLCNRSIIEAVDLSIIYTHFLHI